MKIKTFLLILLLPILACDKEEAGCEDNDTFCAYVDADDFDATGPLINAFLMSQNGDSDAKLEALADWLECKDCVTKAKVLCNSCIETLPEQSELSVDFSTNGQEINKLLDIIMSEPPTFNRYH